VRAASHSPARRPLPRAAATSAALPRKWESRFSSWVPAYAGRTLWPPHPAVPWAPPASPAVGRGVLGSCLCTNDTGAPSPGGALGTAGLSRKGRGVLDCRLRRKDTCWVPAYAGRRPRGTPKGAWIPAYAGMTPSPACSGMTLWPPHPASLDGWPPSPAVGRGVLDCRLRRNDTWGAGMTLGPPHPASLDGWPPSPARGEADWTAAYAGRTLCGFLLMREGHEGAHPKEPGYPLARE
jgi:hypothetical protein